MPAKMTNVYGGMAVSDEAIAKIAAVEATHCIGVVGMAFRSKADKLASLLKKDSASKGVHVSAVNGDVSLEIHVIAEYGVNLSAISSNIAENVKYAVESMVGCTIKKVDVHVEGVRVD
ncbi:MAG: Asp23/Gls24 family envelope stress response protein [Clostridia bacterium]|nr:Asp23/Gls24 family envelope stress response protein [Clostridia bacterium]